jgi:hypothetical protein
MFKYINNQKGSALLLVIMIMVVLVIVGATLATVSLAEVKQGVRHEKLSQAHYVSITGAEAVSNYFMSNQKSDAVKSMISSIESGNTVSFPNVDFPNNVFGDGIFEVTVTGQPGSLSIHSTGTIDNQFNKNNTLVISNIYPDPSWGLYAVAAKTRIEASGASFSILGSIMTGGPQALTSSQLTKITGTKEFNSTAGFPEVKYPFSEFIADYGHTPSNTVNIPNGVTGDYIFNSGNLYNIGATSKGNAIDIGGATKLIFNTGNPGDITMLNLQGDLRQSGNSIMDFRNSSIEGGGMVIFYVDGDIVISGGSWIQAAYAGDVLFYMGQHPDDTTIRTVLFSGNTSYKAHIIAPDAHMTYNGGGSNTFTGMAVVEYFKGHGSFNIVQQPDIDEDLNAFLIWPWTKYMWYN